MILRLSDIRSGDFAGFIALRDVLDEGLCILHRFIRIGVGRRREQTGRKRRRRQPKDQSRNIHSKPPLECRAATPRRAKNAAADQSPDSACAAGRNTSFQLSGWLLMMPVLNICSAYFSVPCGASVKSKPGMASIAA